VKELHQRGLGLATISYDSVQVLSAFSHQHEITFPMLADPGSKTIKRFGLLDTVVDEALGPNKNDPAVQSDIRTYVSVVGVRPFMAGIAYPGTFILDRNGRVKERYFQHSYIERNTISSIMIRNGSSLAPVSGTKISGGHLQITTFPSDSAIAPGNRISLVLDVKPATGAHVYAPGASQYGYHVIELHISPQPYVRSLPLRYPSSQTYYFKPLKQRVPVYQKPFRLVQDVVLEGTLPAQAALRGQRSITISGTLEYQACNEKICFNPTSVPLSWTLALRPIIFERPMISKR
jgi:peroxiredoxin